MAAGSGTVRLRAGYGEASCPRHGTKPKTNAAFWRRKIARNRARDAKVNRALRQLGWKVIRAWEHELATKNRSQLLKRLKPLISTKPH